MKFAKILPNKCIGNFIIIPYLIFMFNYHVSQSKKKKIGLNFAGSTFFHFWNGTADFSLWPFYSDATI